MKTKYELTLKLNMLYFALFTFELNFIDSFRDQKQYIRFYFNKNKYKN